MDVRQEIIEAIARAVATREGDSNDAEIDALWEVVDLVIELLGLEVAA